MHYICTKPFSVNWQFASSFFFFTIVIAWPTMWILLFMLIAKADPCLSSLFFCAISYKLLLAVLKSASIWAWGAWILFESLETLGLNCSIFVWGCGRITEVVGQWQKQIFIIQYTFGFFFLIEDIFSQKNKPCVWRGKSRKFWEECSQEILFPEILLLFLFSNAFIFNMVYYVTYMKVN